jgi:hypothetical protein
MGVVYRAEHLALKRPVALKMILAGGHAGEEERRRFRREAEAAARLQHPNVVQVYEVGEHQGLPFCALEFCAGGNLAGRLRGPLPPREAARLVETLAGAVHLAHSRNVVHRDLKPSNVLLTAGGSPKIADFGLARQLDADQGQTQAGLVMGTPSYMAPEQASGQAHAAGPAADLWALGAVLYECLTGRPPFKGATVAETLAQVRDREPAAPRALNPAVPRDLDTICLKCLRKQPEQRYSSARELGEDLGRFLRGELVLARPVGHLERLSLWARRRPAVAGLLAAVAVVALGGGAAATWFRLDAQDARVREAGVRASQAEELAAYSEAEKQHAEREKQHAEKETQLAREKSELADEKTRAVEDAFAESLVKTLAPRSGPLTPAEVGPLWELAATDNERLRRRYFDLALAGADGAERLGWRAEWAVHAGVGLDPRRRRELLADVLARLRDDGQALPVRLACVELALALGARDEAFARSACKVLGESLAARQPPDEARETLAGAGAGTQVHLATVLSLLAGRLRPGEATELSGKAAPPVLDSLARAPDPQTQTQLAGAVALLAERMEPGPAAEAADKAGRRILTTKARTSEGWTVSGLALPVARLAGRLPPEQAAAATRQVLAAVGKTDHYTALQNLAEAVAKLADRLTPDDAAAATRQALEGLARTTDRTTLTFHSLAVEKLETLLAPDQAAVATRQALDAMSGTTDPNTLAALARAVGTLSGRLAPDEGAAAADGATRQLIAALVWAANPSPEAAAPEAGTASQKAQAMTGDLSRSLVKAPTNQPQPFVLAEAAAKLTERLPPGQAARVIQPVLDVLATTNSPNTQTAVTEAVEKLADRSSTQGLIDLLKVPGCVGRPRQAVLGELARRVGPPAPQAAVAAGVIAALPSSPLGVAAQAWRAEALYPDGRRSFADLGEAVDWVSEHHPELDLRSLPVRAGR